MDAKVTWNGRLSFVGEADTGFHVPLGSDPIVGGDNDGFRPMELFLIGLAGCTGMDVISILQKKRQNVIGFEVQVHGNRSAEHPRVFKQILIEYIVRGHKIDQEAVERAIELSSIKYCPAQAMFSKLMPIEQKITIEEME